MKGGYRAGAGRKQGFAAKNSEEARLILSEMVMSEIRPIGKALIARAKKGDVIAVRELFDRSFGKAPQTAKIDLSDERMPTPILVTWSKEQEGYGLGSENVVSVDESIAEKNGVQRFAGKDAGLLLPPLSPEGVVSTSNLLFGVGRTVPLGKPQSKSCRRTKGQTE